MPPRDAVVVGSGVIGLSTAWHLACRGLSVTIFDPSPGRGASYVAAGMLAPVTEAAWGEEELVEANVRSAHLWEEFSENVEAASGYSIGYRASGTVLVGLDRSDRSALEELLEFQKHLGLASDWRTPSACRDLEPLLSPALCGGIFAPQDHQVDNRRLLVALDETCRRQGIVRDPRPVKAIAVANSQVEGVIVDDDLVPASIVVIAAGIGSSHIGGLPDGALPPVRPVKGQILRLRSPEHAPFLERCVRGLVKGRSTYIVSRNDGRIALGATVEEQGDDTTVTAGAVYDLLRDAMQIIPGLSELELVEACAGLRPGSPDNAPMVGASIIDGVVFATGHYRNGILLAPLTAQAVSSLVCDGELPLWARAFDPARYSMLGNSSQRASGS